MKSNNEKSILRIQFFAPSRSSWIETDLKVLSAMGAVQFNLVSEMSFWSWLFQRPKFDVAYFWFGSLRYLPYLIAAKFLKKKVVIVAGGYDVNSIPEIGYGAFQENFLKRFFRRQVFAKADLILAVSNFIGETARKNLTVPPGRIETAYLPIALPAVAPSDWANRKMQVVFLISADAPNRLVKGVDRIPEICRLMPTVEFKLAGKLSVDVEQHLRAQDLKNLEILGPLGFHSPEFDHLLNSSRVLCCPSRGESFGAAVLDAALLGCYPVGFNVGALGEILGENGSLVPPGDVKALVSAMKSALALTTYDPIKNIKRIETLFSPKARADRLRAVFSALMKESP